MALPALLNHPIPWQVVSTHWVIVSPASLLFKSDGCLGRNQLFGDRCVFYNIICISESLTQVFLLIFLSVYNVNHIIHRAQNHSSAMGPDSDEAFPWHILPQLDICCYIKDEVGKGKVDWSRRPTMRLLLWFTEMSLCLVHFCAQ